MNQPARPLAPLNASATNIYHPTGGPTVLLAFAAPDRSDGVEIERWTPHGGWATLTVVPATDDAYVDHPPPVEVRYRLRSIDGPQNSPWSPILAVIS